MMEEMEPVISALRNGLQSARASPSRQRRSTWSSHGYYWCSLVCSLRVHTTIPVNKAWHFVEPFQLVRNASAAGAQ